MTAAARTIYLDYNATAPLAPECVAAMLPCLDGSYGNPASKHRAGERAKELISVARVQVASLLNASPAEVIFTSGGTESNHQAITGALALLPKRRHVVTSEVEHASTLQLLHHFETTQNIKVTRLPVDGQGQLDVRALDDAITSETALVTLLWANNETGTLLPVEAAARMAKAKGALFHTDAVQAVGKVPVDLARLPADFLSLSGHKLHAPSGVGGLFVRKGVKLPPLLYGHQERGRRGGTENVAGIVALGVACRLAGVGLSADAGRIVALRDRLEQGILRRMPFASVNGRGTERVGNTCNIRFGGLEGEVIVSRLDRLGIYVSQGAACGASGTEPSHVLTAMGLDRRAAFASLRFSLGRYTSEEEIDDVLEALSSITGALMGAAA